MLQSLKCRLLFGAFLGPALSFSDDLPVSGDLGEKRLVMIRPAFSRYGVDRRGFIFILYDLLQRRFGIVVKLLAFYVVRTNLRINSLAGLRPPSR